MKININLEKKYAFLILGAVLLLAGVFAVWAYNSNPANPSKLGHTLNEVDGITCAAGQAVTRNATGWSCVAVGGSGNPSGSFLGNGTVVGGARVITIPAPLGGPTQYKCIASETWGDVSDQCNNGALFTTGVCNDGANPPASKVAQARATGIGDNAGASTGYSGYSTKYYLCIRFK